ncbi:MAG: aldehyde dehydrogenase [Nitrospinaceae bacterium]|nr:MAG: aldehyde dehydrogenase [Nitrospinaceae bacterium]
MNDAKGKSDVLEVFNPYDHKPIGSVPLTSWEEADKMLETASRLYKNLGAWLPAYKRIEVLKKTAALMQERSEELAFQIANEGGKPLIDARIEVARAIDGVGLCIKGLDHMAGTEIPMDLTAAGAGKAGFTFREPIGPVIAVSAFNHPLNLIVHQVGPAIAVGCPVIVKPAGVTPLSAKAFVDMLYEAGLPEDWCRFAACKSSVAEKLVTDPRTAFLTFIGSGKIGWMLRSKLAPGTRCALEHGGVAPVIVDESADIDAMIPPLLKGGFYHAGQVCVSVQRVFAPKAMAKDIAERLAAGASKLKVGNAIEESTEVGPLIQPAETDRISEWVQEAVHNGTEALCGGEKLGDTTYAPTVLLDPPANAKVSTEEIFGPVVCVYGYDDIDQGISQANALPFAFQAACFTNQLDTAMKCVRELDAATVIVNDHTAFRVDWMPFAGHRHSGYGIGGIAYTMHDMTHEKLMVLNGFYPKA